MIFIERFLHNNPSLRSKFRDFRWQMKKIPVLRELSILTDTLYFRLAGNERRTGYDYPEGDEYFESYANILVPKAKGRVLDIGCGHGFLTERFAGCESVKSVIGLDKIDEFVGRHPKIGYVTGDIVSGELPVGPFDTVSSSEFIEHINELDFRHLVDKIASTLAPGGSFIGSTPRNPTPYKWFSGSRYHIREYNEKDLRDLLSEHFTQVEVRPVSEFCLVWEASVPKRTASASIPSPRSVETSIISH